MVSITSIDIGMMTPQQASLGNFIWDDVDQDGLQDAGETGVVGVTVQLWSADMSTLVSSTTTNAQGNYQLVTPEPESYRLRLIVPSGFSLSPKDIGGNDLLDSDFNTAAPVGFTDVYTIASNVISVAHIDGGVRGQLLFSSGFE